MHTFRKIKYIWRSKNRSVKFKKYISRHLVVRLSMLIALISAAALFDMYHTPDGKKAQVPASDEADSAKVFFCSQVPVTNLKTSGTDFVVRFRFACTQDKFLLKHYNLRTFLLMKAETTQVSFPSVSSFHSLPFNRTLYPNSDDTPPLS